MKLFRYIALSLLMISGGAAAEITSTEAFINSSTNQGKLTQVMLKNYMLVGLSVRARKAEQDLGVAITEYEAAQKEINAYVKTDAVREPLRSANEQWKRVKGLYLEKPSKENAEKVREQTELLLKLWNLVTIQIVENTDSHFGPLVSTAGHVRMLSQRVSSLYALRAWGFNERYAEAFVSTLELFEQKRTELESSQLNNEQIKGELSKIQRDFKRFKELSDQEATKAMLGLIARSSEKITKSMDKVTAMYMYQGLSF